MSALKPETAPALELGETAAVEISLAEAFERQVEKSAGRFAIVAGSREITYDELNSRANRLARSILNLQNDESSPVALLLQPGASALAGLIAAFKTGMPALPLDPSYPEEAIAHFLRDAGARIVVADEANAVLARRLCERGDAAILNVESIRSSTSDSNIGRRIDPRSPCILHYTSGSTGQPKGIFQIHHNLVRRVEVHRGRYGAREEDRFLMLSSTAFSASNGVIYPALLTGASIHCFDLATEGLDALASRLISQRITIYQSVPAVFRRLVDSLPAAAGFPELRMVRLGGDSIFREDFERYCRRFPDSCRFSTSLASTEAGAITQYLADKTTEFEGPLVPVGSPVPGVELRLIDEDGRDIAPGEVGEIEVASPYLAGGYWRKPELTSERLRPHPRGGHWRVFRTGDLGRLRPDGLFEHRGRIDDRTKVRGYRVEPAAVEAALRALPEVRDAAIVAEQTAVRGEHRLVAYIVPADPASWSARELRAALLSTVPAYMVPELFVTLDRIPLTPRGKIDRKALPAPEPEPAALGASPKDEMESELCRIWEKVLHVDSVGVDQNFFDLGGQSLLAAELLAEIERRWKRALALPVLLDAPTIRQLADVLRKPESSCPTAIVALTETGARTPFFCVPGGNGPGFNFRTLARLLGEEQPFYAFHVATESGEEMPWTVEAWVDRFLPALRGVQAHGPYRLGGHSFGGNVAYEMARRLSSEGEPVQFVALLDTYAPGYPKRTLGLGYTIALLADFLRRPMAAKLEAVERRLKRLFGDTPIGAAISKYDYRPIPIPVILFRASERITRRGISFDDPDNGWRSLAGDLLETHPVAGNHDTLIEGAGAEEMARWLTRHLSEPTHLPLP